jgi:hypothetical protein
MTRPWVVTLFNPPVLRVSRQEYARLQREPRLRAQLPPLYRDIGGQITVRPTPRKYKASQPCSRCGEIANPEHITDCRLAPELVGPSISGLCPRCYREWARRDHTEEPHPP